MTPRICTRQALDVLVIGAGQAGLAMGRELERRRLDHLIIDGARSVGDSWRQRWDSLELFTPARYSALPGIPFPADPDHYPTKDEVADYLAAYARAFSMPIALDEPVRQLRSDGPLDFVAVTDYACYRARQVVIATGGFQHPRVPAFANSLSADITQLHSSQYRRPSDVPDGPVVIVGGGNSGVQIAQELSASHPVTLAVGSHLRRLPRRLLGHSVFDWLDKVGFLDVTAESRLGRRMRHLETLIGESPRRIARSHDVTLSGRIVQAEGAGLRADRGERLDTRSVVWATGFAPRYDWVHLSAFDREGRPLHHRGVSVVPGLHFLGLPWQHTRGSALIGWVARDATYLADAIEYAAPRRRRWVHRSAYGRAVAVR